jgi:hypothetical protein
MPHMKTGSLTACSRLQQAGLSAYSAVLSSNLLLHSLLHELNWERSPFPAASCSTSPWGISKSGGGLFRTVSELEWRETNSIFAPRIPQTQTSRPRDLSNEHAQHRLVLSMLALDLDNCAHLPKVGWVDSSSTRSTHTPERIRGVCPHVVDHVVRRRFHFHLVRVVTLRVVLLLVFSLLLLVSSLPSLASLPGSANVFLIGIGALSSVAASPSQGPNNK